MKKLSWRLLRSLDRRPVLTAQGKVGSSWQHFTQCQNRSWLVKKPYAVGAASLDLNLNASGRGRPRLFTIGIDHPEPGCRIATVANEAMSDALQEAERLLAERLGSVSLAALVRTFEGRRDA